MTTVREPEMNGLMETKEGWMDQRREGRRDRASFVSAAESLEIVKREREADFRRQKARPDPHGDQEVLSR